MDLSYEFELSLPVDEAFAFLTDIERIAPCMPGAELRDVEGETYRGIVKVKLGPITAAYRGDAQVVEIDPEQHRAVLMAKGREMLGQGTAQARVTATLTARGDVTAARIDATLDIAGRAAQFGRGVLDDVSQRLFGEFVAGLQDAVAPTARRAPRTTPEVATTEPPESPAGPLGEDIAPRNGHGREAAAPIDVFSVAGMPIAKRLAPIAVAVVVIALLLRRRRR